MWWMVSDLSPPGRQPANPPQRPVLFVNPRSGGGTAARAGVVERARKRGIEAVSFAPGQSLEALAREAVANGADALGVAGGDGSLAVVAAAATAHGLPFVCVPAGTRNHFALDLGLDPHDVLGALDALTDGIERLIDVAEVNGRLFLNNVSLGIYGEAVRSPAYRDAKMRTLLETTEKVLGPSAEVPALRLVDDVGREHQHPALVLVSNNPYTLDRPLTPGARPALDSGRLGIIVLDAPDAAPHPPEAAPQPPGRAWSAPRLHVSAQPPVHAGIDGEAIELSPPLQFTSRPGALRVRIPARHQAEPRSAPLSPARRKRPLPEG
jgi:diacylglycerol kinase family enzyme